MNEAGVEIPINKETASNHHMTANKILLQKKYARIVRAFADAAGLELDEALGFFFRSDVYFLMKNGIPDMHCMSDAYLAEDLLREYRRSVTNKSLINKINLQST